MYNLSMTAYLRGDFQEARDVCESAIDGQRRISIIDVKDKDSLLIDLLAHLAQIYRALNGFVQARLVFESFNFAQINVDCAADMLCN